MPATSLLETPPEFFEAIYADAHGERTAVPWDDGRASTALVNWLNVVAPSLIRCGSRVAVVGCGLGDDARELMRRGYDVTAFDCSETAIDWARRLDPPNAASYVKADLFSPPSRWRHRFDLVVEISTLQALNPDLRLGAASAIADLLAPRGRLLVIARGADEPVEAEAGPPWPLTVAELSEAMSLAGLASEGPITSFVEDGDPPTTRIRAVFKRV